MAEGNLSIQKDALVQKLSSPDQQKEKWKKWQRESNEDGMGLVIDEDNEEYQRQMKRKLHKYMDPS